MKQILIAILFLSSELSFGQSFEGTLTYKSNLEVSENLEKMGMTKEMLVENLKKEGSWADTIKIFYKQGNYYTSLNSNPKSWTIYKAETNKIYSVKNDEDICTVTDASVDLEYSMTGKRPTVQKIDTTAMVNGVTCNVVRVKWDIGTYDYYYNPTMFVINPALFSKHVFDGWADFLKISSSLPLKIVKTTNGMMENTMTLIVSKAEVVDEKIFSVPTLVPDKDLNLIKVPNREVMRIKK